jgi:hypothetical protein
MREEKMRQDKEMKGKGREGYILTCAGILADFFLICFSASLWSGLVGLLTIVDLRLVLSGCLMMMMMMMMTMATANYGNGNKNMEM